MYLLPACLVFHSLALSFYAEANLLKSYKKFQHGLHLIRDSTGQPLRTNLMCQS